MMFVSPKNIVDLELKLTTGMKVADFGCGSGHFTVEMARGIGSDGVVYAFDVQEEALSALKSKASAVDVGNIEMARVDLEVPKSTGLADSLVDLVLISNMLFQVSDRSAISKEAFRVLKSGGRVVVIEWDSSAKIAGPPKESRIDKKTTRSIFEKEGFVFDREFSAGESHYGLIFVK